MHYEGWHNVNSQQAKTSRQSQIKVVKLLFLFSNHCFLLQEWNLDFLPTLLGITEGY